MFTGKVSVGLVSLYTQADKYPIKGIFNYNRLIK